MPAKLLPTVCQRETTASGSTTVSFDCSRGCVCFLPYLLFKHTNRDHSKSFHWAPPLAHLVSALTSDFPDFPVQHFRGRKEVVLTTLTWFGGQNHFLPIAYLVTSSLILLIAVFLTIVWWRYGKDGKNFKE